MTRAFTRSICFISQLFLAIAVTTYLVVPTQPVNLQLVRDSEECIKVVLVDVDLPQVHKVQHSLHNQKALISLMTHPDLKKNVSHCYQ